MEKTALTPPLFPRLWTCPFSFLGAGLLTLLLSSGCLCVLSLYSASTPSASRAASRRLPTLRRPCSRRSVTPCVHNRDTRAIALLVLPSPFLLSLLLSPADDLDPQQILLSSLRERICERPAHRRAVGTTKGASQLLLPSREDQPPCLLSPPCRSLDLASGEGRGKERFRFA